MNSPAARILVVDDDPMILRLFSTALLREGYEVSVAKTGREALQQMTTHPVEVLLLDINLPDMNGIEVMRQFVATTGTIVILITGDDASISHEAALQQGAADFIVKPVRLPELAMRIKQAREMRLLADAKARLVAELEHLAVKDELTGLFNYRHFQAQLKSEVQRVARYERPLALIILDVDHFKEINDTLGHAVGDQVLAGIANVLRESVRATDSVYRYGGEEFAMLLPETPGEPALGVAERARLAVEKADLAQGRRVTISAGMAEYRSPERGEELLRRADAALYVAKRTGRNRVAMA
jgi:two-component system, cell cycle response regulator